MALTVSSAASILKTLYPKKRLFDAVYRGNPFLESIKKMENFVGNPMNYAIKTGNPGNISADAATAFAGTGTHAASQFQITTGHLYGLCSLDGEVLRAADGASGSFIQALEAEVDGTLNGLRNELGRAMFGTGFGAIGRTVEVTGTKLTLDNAEDIVNFEVGDVLVFAASDADALRDSGDSVTVSAVNRSAGSMTVGTLTGISGLTTLDRIYKKGNRPSGASGTAILPIGLGGWIPATLESGNFFSASRAANPERLAGQRVVAGGVDIGEAILEASRIVSREGNEAKVCWLNPLDLKNLSVQLGSQKQFTSSEGSVGFSWIVIYGQSGEVRCRADRSCPQGQAWLVNPGDFELWSRGPAVGILEEDGNTMLRNSDDTYSTRFGGHLQLICTNPAAQCHITL